MVGAGDRVGDSRRTSGVYVSGGYVKMLPGLNGLFFVRTLAGKSVSQFQVGVAMYLKGRGDR